MNFEQRIADYISVHQLMSREGLYLLGLSGGPDSVALLRALLSLGYHVEAMHCNFHLRGDESQRDEDFCVSLCQQLQVPLHRVHFDTRSYATLHQVSIEMAARDLRYGYFHRLMHDLDAQGIVIAHHQDDHVETVLLNLVRGTGLQGLLGIRPKKDDIIRPMLGVTRTEVLDYLKTIHQDYVVDSSNLVDDVKRNIVRHEVVPVLERLNPSFGDKVAQMTEQLSEVASLVKDVTERTLSVARVSADEYDLKVLRQSPAPELLFWQLLGPKGFTRPQVIEMAQASQTGSHWLSPQTVALIHRDRLVLADRSAWEQRPRSMRIPEAGNYVCAENCHLKISTEPFTGSQQISKDPGCATLDADKVKFPLTLRSVDEGDRFVPFGMEHEKLVSDYLTDRHVSLIDKRRQLLLADSDNRVVWLLGRRTDGRFAVESDVTKTLLRIELNGF